MGKNKDCVIVKYRNGEAKKISNEDIENIHSIEEDISFFYEADFSSDYQQSIFLIDSDSISEVVFQNFNFMDSPFRNFRLETSKGISVVFDHCKIGDFKSYEVDDLPTRKGNLIFNDCNAHSLLVTADKVVMRGKACISSQTIVDANNAFFEGEISLNNLDIFGKVIYIDKTNMNASYVSIFTESLAFSDSTFLSTNINLRYKNLFTYHSSFTSLEYRFNDDIWHFDDKIKISSDDVICDVDFARVRFLKSLKKYQKKSE